ncbi:MAG: S8 family peptidase [Gammaproteobacteria bacterium]|nr:S8 family peptidase [Gammaproteobacteria bacterium]
MNYREPVTRASTPDIPAEITKARLFERQKRTLEDFSTQLGNSTRWVRNMSGNAAVVAVDDGQTLHEIRQRLSALDYVESVDIDALVWPAAVPNDELYGEQWQLGSSDQSAGAINAEAAWDLVSGDASTVIAVIDTGIRSEHPDLQGRLLPGYDFVSGMNLNIEGDVPIPLQYEYLRANDGDGRDPDPTDPGDGVEFSTTVEMNTYGVNCPATASTWHGTAVASVIAANSNDGFGMAGLAQHTKILPVRSMGRCGGRRSDLIDAIRWAAGVGDPAITENLYPADIINLSLGVDDVCTLSDQRAINDAVAAGSIVVAAIGNGSRNADANPTSPSQCDNVIGVLATDHNGHRTNYSSYGADADIAAPGGRVPDSSFAILVASNAGERAPSSQQTYRQVTGTSIAAPHVSGVLALMQAANPSLTNYELEGLLYRSVRPHNTISGSGCTDRTCGWGLLDAYESVVNAIEFTSGDELPIPQLSPALDGSITRGNQSFGCSVVSGTVSEKPHKMAIDWFLLLLMSSTCLVIRKTVRFRSDDAIR